MSSAKPLFIVIVFLVFVALLAGSALGSTDLTPDTPPAEPGAVNPNAFLAPDLGARAASDGSSPDVSPAGGVAANALLAPGAGTCGSAYTIRSGDTLFRIAQACGLTLQAVLNANPEISDPNLIHTGQTIHLPAAVAAPAAAGAAVPTQVARSGPNQPGDGAPTGQPALLAPGQGLPSGFDEAFGGSQESAVGDQPGATKPPAAGSLPAATPAPESIQVQPRPGQEGARISPGDTIEVRAGSLTPGVRARVDVGPIDGLPAVFGENTAGPDGAFTLDVQIPPEAIPGREWIVTITTLTGPRLKYTSLPFVVEEKQ